MSVIDELLENARRYADGFAHGDLPGPPAKRVAVLACMDSRLNPYGLLGLSEGDAHVIRNAGGVVTADELRSLAISQRLLGTTEIMLIHHTECGMLALSEERLFQDIEAETGVRPSWSTEAFTDLDADLRENIARIHAEPAIPHQDAVRGFVYDVADGTLREVSP